MRRFLSAVLIAGAAIGTTPAVAGLFSSRFDDFKELAEAGKAEAALAFVAGETAYFAKLDGKKKDYVLGYLGRQFAEQEQRGNDEATLKWLAAHAALFGSVGADAAPGYQQTLAAVSGRRCGQLKSTGFVLAQAQEAPTLRRWTMLRRALPAMEQALKTASLLPPQAACPAPQMQATAQAMQRLRAELLRDARAAFMSYGPFSQPAFDTQYPVAVDMAALAQDNPELEQLLRNARMPELRRYADMYLKKLPAAERRLLSARYLDELARERGTPGFADKTRLAQELGKQGFTPPPLKDRVLVAYWAPHKPDEGQAFELREAASEVSFQRLEEAQTPLQFLQSGAARGRDLVVFMRFSPVKSEREARPATQLRSNYRAGTRRVANPEYAQALQEVREAERQAKEAERLEQQSSSASTDSTWGVLSVVTGAVTASVARSNFEKALAQLEETSEEIEEPVLVPYSYSRTPVTARKTATLRYAAYDSGTGKTVTGSVSPSVSREFAVLEGVRPDDPDQAAILAGGVAAQKVEEFAKGGLWDDHAGVWSKFAEAYLK